jgi:murein tripeptide amidase MpaA
VKIGDGPWKLIEGRYTYLAAEGNLELTFTQSFDVDATYWFAFTYPWSYTDNDILLTALQKSVASQERIYFHREVITRTIERRNIELVTISDRTYITSEREPTLPNLYPGNSGRPFKFASVKKVVFFSARVHPGETPGSHVMNGILKFLCSDDPRAVLVRKFFVFKIVPMINPDGVYRGYFRSDTKGINLNRLYNTPSVTDAP